MLLFVSTIVGCSGTGHQPPPSSPTQEDTSLGPGDVFNVRVYREDDLSGTYRVGADGEIDFPLVGVIHVAGLQPQAVAGEIANALREGQYLRDPHVSVLVEEYASKRVTVVGAVSSPGTFPVAPGMTVVQVIGQAGGFTPLANRNGVVLTRSVGGVLRRFPVAAGDISNGRQSDFPIAPGDIVFVPERVF